MRNDDEAVDLILAGIGEREHRPVGAALAGAHVHALDDAVRPRRSGHLDAVGVGAVALDRVGEVDGRCVAGHIDRLDRVHRPRRKRGRQQATGSNDGTQQAQNYALPSSAIPAQPLSSSGAAPLRQALRR